MKIKHLSILFAAITLYSCGSGTTQNSGTQNADTTANNADTVAAAPTVSQPSPKPLVFEVAEKLAETGDAGFSTDDLEKLDMEEINKTPQNLFFRPWDMGIAVNCFPYTNGGCFVFVVLDLVCDCDGAYEYHSFNYNNGKISKTALPTELKSNLKNNFIECEGNTLKIPQKNLTFNWNGEKFVLAPENQPSEEDLSQVEDIYYPSGLNKFLTQLPNTYTTDSIYRTNITVDDTDDSFDRYYFYAFPYQNGGYLILEEHCQRIVEGDLDKFNTYNYKDGKLVKVDGILPVPALAEFLDTKKCEGHDDDVKIITKLYNTGADKYIIYFPVGKQLLYTQCYPQLYKYGADDWDTDYDSLMKDDRLLPYFKWNGEKFIKQ